MPPKIVLAARRAPPPPKKKAKAPPKTKDALRFSEIDGVGTFRVGGDSDEKTTALMSFGLPKDVHFASLAARERGFNPPASNTYLQATPAPALAGGTVLSHELDMELPCLTGNWNVATLADESGLRSGVMLWHVEKVGNTCEDAAKLVRDMEALGAGPIQNNPTASVINAGIYFIGRYDWTEESLLHNELEEDDAFKFDDMVHSDVIPYASFTFVPAKVWLDNVWPFVVEKADADENIADALNGVYVNDVLVGISNVLKHSEYPFGRVFVHSEGGQRVGAKAFLWYTYNVPEEFSGLNINGAVI